MAGRRSCSLDTRTIQSLLSREDDGEFIDVEGDSDSDDTLDDIDKDGDYVFETGYSESEECSDNEHEGPSATILPPPHTLAAAASSPSSTSWLQPSLKYGGRQCMKRIWNEGRRCGISGRGIPGLVPSAGI